MKLLPKQSRRIRYSKSLFQLPPVSTIIHYSCGCCPFWDRPLWTMSMWKSIRKRKWQRCASTEGFISYVFLFFISWDKFHNLIHWVVHCSPILEIAPLWQCFWWSKLEVLLLLLNELLVHHRLTPTPSSTHLYSCMETNTLRLKFFLVNISEPSQNQPIQRAAKRTLSNASKPQPEQSVPIRKPATQKPAITSTYSASYGRPSSAKSLMRPTSSQGSAKMYLDSVLSKDKKNGTVSKALFRKQGNVIIIWEWGTKSAWVGRWPSTHRKWGIHSLTVEYLVYFLLGPSVFPVHNCFCDKDIGHCWSALQSD